MYSVSVICGGIKEYYLNVLLTRCKYHTVGICTAKLYGLKVGNKRYLLTHKLLGLIEFSDAGYHLALLIAKVYLKLKKLLCLGNRLCGKYLAYAELYLTKVLYTDLGLVLRLFYTP